MKKFYFTLIVCLIVSISISFYIYFKSDDSQSIANLQQEGSKKPMTPPKQDASISSHKTDMVAPSQAIKDFIDNAPFKQEDTHSILARNPEKIQSYLSGFSKLIDKNIMNNSTLNENQKAEILWSIFKEYNWLGKDNAFKAIVKDNLMYLRNKSLIPDITKTYGDIASVGEKSENYRHDLLEIINSLEINPQNSANKLVIDTMRSELRSINSRNEAQNLGDLAIKVLYDYGKATGVDIISDVTQSANHNPQASLSYINSILKLTLSDGGNTSQLQNLTQSNLTQATKNDLNKVISFNLKEDGNIPLSSLNKESLIILDQYLDREFSNSMELSGDADLKRVYEKITEALK